MCLEFYLILKLLEQKQSLLENDYLFSNHVVTGYFGEVVAPESAALWGLCLGCLFLDRVEIWLGEASKLAAAAGGEVQKHTKSCWFVLVGWAIYPLGYMMGTTGWYNGLIQQVTLM
jgi:hypothetical protein